jgi:hypothetical protein
VQTFPGVASGSFSAPNHDYPSSLIIQLQAKDSGGMTATTSVTLNPKTVSLTLQSNPSGLRLTESATTARTPFTFTAIVNAQIVVTAPAQKLRGRNYAWVSWSDGGDQSHTITAPSTAATYPATYQRGR